MVFCRLSAETEEGMKNDGVMERRDEETENRHFLLLTGVMYKFSRDMNSATLTHTHTK